jgi:hypothetical protein
MRAGEVWDSRFWILDFGFVAARAALGDLGFVGMVKHCTKEVTWQRYRLATISATRHERSTIQDSKFKIQNELPGRESKIQNLKSKMKFTVVNPKSKI